MEKVTISPRSSKYAVKRLIDDIEMDQDVLSEARNMISKGFKDLREDWVALASDNGVLDVDSQEILDINVGGVHHVRDQEYPDLDQGDNYGGSVQ